MQKWTTEQLTCPDCEFIARDMRGLNGHRQFKHGTRAANAQLPLQQQDRLISESVLLSSQLVHLVHAHDMRPSEAMAALEECAGAMAEVREESAAFDDWLKRRGL